jgi:hypothetical protein
VTEKKTASLSLNWQDNSDDEEQFVIYYSTDGNYFLNHGTVSADTTTYFIDGLACGATYYFQVYARGSHSQGWLGASNVTKVTTDPCITPEVTIPSAGDIIAVNCNELVTADTSTQLSIVESEPNCAKTFIYLLEEKPFNYLDAFYRLIPSRAATDALFIAVYEEQIAARFLFSPDVVDDLYSNLPAAISACVDYDRCSDWSKWPLTALYSGEMYQCPDLSRLDEAGLLQSLPYGDYSCTELTAKALRSFASESTISQLSDLSRNHQWDWSRRNAVRVLGRFAEFPESEVAHVLVMDKYTNTVQDTLVNRLETDTAKEVLYDTIWVLDSFFYPNFEMQPQLEDISLKTDFDVNLRFRAMAAISRLVNAKSGLISEHDIDFLIRLLQSDNVWIRAQAAFTFQVLDEQHLDESRRTLIKEAIQAAWTDEEQLIGRAYLAHALDRYFGTTYHDELREGYERTHLLNSMSGGNILISSGLPEEKLDSFLTLIQGEQQAFFDFFGQLFETPVVSDTNHTITLKLFVTKAEYQDYMNAFVGHAAGAGGIYVERDGTFYTYQREAEQSAFTVEELIQHEFGHYLQGRYVFPGLWTDPNYHEEPKAWADEGLSEFLASFTFDENGNYTYSTRDVHLDKLCNAPRRDLASLLGQREGYDQHGTFDYANGWSFIFYLITKRFGSAVNLFTSFRDGSYTLENFAEIAGVSSVSELEREWHSTIDWWCQVYKR